MAKTFDRSKAEKILEGYPAKDWTDDERNALLGELETCYVEDSRLSAIKAIVDKQINTVGLYAGTMLWTVYGVLQEGLPLPGHEPIEVKGGDDSVHVSVFGVPANLNRDEAKGLIEDLTDALNEMKDHESDTDGA